MNDLKSVLLIDDSRVSRMKLRQLILQKHPEWKIFEAATGEEGIQQATKEAPDLITVDINMPGMGGLAAAEELIAINPKATIVLLTGNIQDSSKRKATEIGVYFVEKPITESSVTKVLSFLKS